MTRPAFFDDRGVLAGDGPVLADIAAATGTPVYVYSAAAIVDAYSSLDRAFGDYPHRLHYALKANSSLAIVRLLARQGSGADANSVGEIEVALRAGFAPRDIVFSGVGKREDELARAVALGVHAINVESAGEAQRISAIAGNGHVQARVAVRVNPDIDAESHRHITTGRADTKFGVAVDDARRLCHAIAADPSLRLVGLHVHIGSQIMTVGPLERAAGTIAALAADLRERGIALEHLDFGGGVGVAYDGGEAMTFAEYARMLVSVARPTGLPVLIEPGRVIVASSGVLLTRVVDIKTTGGPVGFAVLDAGMTELLRPALYGAYHRIEPLERREAEPRQYQLVGPLCETSDSYGEPRWLQPLAVGDVLAIRDVGAYGSAMASNYNRRPLAPEVLVEDGRWRVIRRRQTLEDLLALEEG